MVTGYLVNIHRELRQGSFDKFLLGFCNLANTLDTNNTLGL